MANMFNEDGTYNKTEWKTGDRITANKLNKIEESLEAINNNDISRHVETDARLDELEERVSEGIEGPRFEELNNLVIDMKDDIELDIYEINAKMAFLEDEFNDGMKQLFQSVSDGKTLVARAITDKGVSTASDATYETMANNIRMISGGFIDDTESNNIFMYGFSGNNYTLKYEDANGVLASFADVGRVNARTLSNSRTIFENKDLINCNIAPYRSRC